MAHPLAYYAKVSAACFAVGAAMETFMIHTGFYEKVVELETQRLEDSREDREEFLIRLREELERQAAQKHVKLSLPDAARRPPA